ncbi:MAG: hypothetical protein EA350_06030 [Gemmatimonadales bacterium]|nr:MAG: hypothetical protein EA350_06030 [Gemmatimonadales bacterium]
MRPGVPGSGVPRTGALTDGVRTPGRLCVGVLAAAALLFAGCEVRGGPGERIRGEGFELRCDPGCGPRAAELLADLGRTRDSVAVWFGVAPDAAPSVLDGERNLRIRLYASEAPFLRADRRLASGRFARQQAFSHQRSRSAHILAEGSPDPRRWERFGPGFQGERLVVHEAAHLVTYALARDASWPSWVSEGIASHAEEGWAEALSAAGPARTEGRLGEPWLHSQRHARARLLRAGGFPSAATLIRSDLDHLPLATRYAVWAAFVGVLLEEPFRGRTREFLREIAGPRPPAGWTRASVADRFEARFDSATLDTLDARIREVISAEEVAWVELRRSAGWTPSGLLQLAVSLDPLLWHPRETEPTPPPAGVRLRAVAEPVGSGRASGSGLLLVLGVRDGALDGDAVGVAVGMGAAPRLVRVPLQSDALPRPWRGPDVPEAQGGLGDGEPPAPGEARREDGTGGFPVGEFGGTPVLLELALQGERVTLRIGGGPEVRWVVPGLRPSGEWGVGTTGGMAVLWRELQLDRDDPAPGPDAGPGSGPGTGEGNR